MKAQQYFHDHQDVEIDVLTQERDAAREERDCRQREHDMRVKLAGELESAKDEAREARATLLEFCEHEDGTLTNGPLKGFSGLQWIRLYAALDKARAEREEVEHE